MKQLEQAYKFGGWMYPGEMDWLYEQARTSKLVLELGVWQGRSTACFCEGVVSQTPAGQVFAIDHWQGAKAELNGPHRNMLTPEGRKQTFLAACKNLHTYLDRGVLQLVYMSTERAFHFLAPYVLSQGGADLIFIDAAHDKDSFKQDVTNYLTLLAPGGLLCGHDYKREFGVPDGLAELKEQIGTHKIAKGSIWYLEPHR